MKKPDYCEYYTQEEFEALKNSKINHEFKVLKNDKIEQISLN